VKTTIEIPDQLFRRAKARAAERGESLKQLVIEALQEKLARPPATVGAVEPPWMDGFGKLRHLAAESGGILARVEEAFEAVEPEDRS
jgi:hypothetical protein